MPCHFSSITVTVDGLICSEDSIDLREVRPEEKHIIFSECGLLPENIFIFSICSNHHDHFITNNRRRCRRKVCEIPMILSSHKEEGRSYMKERSLSMDQVCKISRLSGVILPVGTGIKNTKNSEYIH